MRRRRFARFGFAVVMMGTAACSAIAGLDGEYGLDEKDGATAIGTDAGDASKTDGNPSGTDAKVPVDGQGTADTGPSDGGTPDADATTPDPCLTRGTLTAAPLASTPAQAASCSADPLCFNFWNNNKSSPFGWDSRDQSGGTATVIGNVTGADRRLHAEVVPEAGAGTSAALWIQDWISGTQGTLDPLPLDNSTTLKLNFLFFLLQADRQADLMQLKVNGKTYALTVYPDPCGGLPRVAQSGENGASLVLGATVQLNQWYIGEIHFNREPGNTWSGDVMVGGVKVGSTNGIFASGLPHDLDAAIGGGLINAGPGSISASTIVDIDEIFMVRQAFP